MKNLFKTKLQAIMKERHLSQAEIAEMAKCSQNTVSKWLNKNCLPNIRYVEPLAKALKLTIGDLIGSDLSADNFTETEKRFLALPAQRKEFLLKLMDFLDTNA